MQAIAATLDKIINEYRAALNTIPLKDFNFKPAPEKWSKKEIIGHIIDSAQNNLRRFIVAQYEETPLVVYNQDKWVVASNYQQWDADELISLWFLQNNQIVYILNNMSAGMSQRKCQTQSLHTIEWLAGDYIKHLLHHLHVVLNLEPVAYP